MDEGRLAEFVTAQAGEPVEIRSMRRVAFTHSRAVYDLDTSAGRLIMRMLVDGAGLQSVADEFALMQSLRAAGIPVANPRWCEPVGKVLGRPFLVTDYVDGQSVADDDRGSDSPAAAGLVKALAALHELPLDDHLPTVDPLQATHIQIEHWRNVGKTGGGGRVPLLDFAEMWLHQHVPVSVQLALVHGAPQPANVVMAGGAVQAVTEWAFAHVSDPIEDWSYLATQDGTTAKVREWRAVVEREGGVRTSDDEWLYWEAFNLYKGACMGRVSLVQFERGVNRSPRMAIAGTAGYHSRLRRLVNIVES
ncbi:MAG: phosphotransferase family protein [Ilumatobacteraceae bacterium]